MSFLEAVKESEWLISKGYELEALGRKLAADREAFVSEEDYGWFDEMTTWHKRASDFCFMVVKNLITVDELLVIREITSDGIAIDTIFKLYIYRRVASSPRRRKDKIISVFEDLERYKVERLIEYLKHYDEYQQKLTGRSGIWLFGRVMTIDDYTFSAFLNDYTSCFHQFLNWFNRKIGSVKEVADRVFATPDASPSAIRIAILWRNAVEAYRKWHLYLPGDYDVLHAFCHLSDIEFRVGSAAGHATHVHVGPLIVEATYYDNDENVHTLFIKLCEHYGCRVVDHKENDFTKVSIPRTLTREFFQGVLPFVTSADYRLKYQFMGEFWGLYFLDDMIALRDKGLMDVDLEHALCLKAYQRFISEVELGG